MSISVLLMNTTRISAKTPEDYRCPLANCSSGEEENIICTGLDCTKLVEAVRMEFAAESVQCELSDNPGRLGLFSYLFPLLIFDSFRDFFFKMNKDWKVSQQFIRKKCNLFVSCLIQGST